MFTTKLGDGTRIRVRPVVPGDKARLIAGFTRLSERSRFFRFLSAVSHLSESDLARFTASGNDDHRAFGVLDESQEPPLPAAIARYERLGTDPGKAEMAITVVDAYQGRGVGSLLLGAIAFCAVRAEISTFVAFVHPENMAMARLIVALGGHLEAQDGSERIFHLPIFADASKYPKNAPGDRMRTAYTLMAKKG